MIIPIAIMAVVSAIAVSLEGTHPTKPESRKYCESAVLFDDKVYRCQTFGVTQDTGYRVNTKEKKQ